jgi:hypothetical protein
MPRTVPAPVITVSIDCKPIVDEDSFHDIFAKALGFFPDYGRNMNAWIDVLTCLDDNPPGLSKVLVPKGGLLLLRLTNVGFFSKRAPKQYAHLIDCSAFVNYRRVVRGERPILVLSFDKSAG